MGRNQRNRFDAQRVGPHEHYLDCLFNRGRESCRQLYDRMVERPSPTRANLDRLSVLLRRQGISDIIETNVICYSTDMSSDLRLTAHAGGEGKGRDIFRTLLGTIEPAVLIAHGSATSKDLGNVLGVRLPPPPSRPAEPLDVTIGTRSVFVVPSLAPPGYSKWARWAWDHLEKVSVLAAARLAAAS